MFGLQNIIGTKRETGLLHFMMKNLPSFFKSLIPLWPSKLDIFIEKYSLAHRWAVDPKAETHDLVILPIKKFKRYSTLKYSIKRTKKH